MKKALAIVFLILLGCGYTTRGFLHEGESIFIAPVKNKIKIAKESRKYAGYVSYPVLIEKRLTNALIEKFQTDGHLKVTSSEPYDLKLALDITDYRKETLRYTDSDDIEEQRLWLTAFLTLTDNSKNIINRKEIRGEATFFLVGPQQQSEGFAQNELVSDTARRILEAVVEEW
ncbi:MAG: hypothetical protein JSW17_03275 [Candidatus Omnitrophota bacterium]|nr:MAG: hypothetical protein JSW17_03275 [Candidatus Omnitrophota bacterium]